MQTIAQASARLEPPSLQTAIETGGHRIIADEPASLGGQDGGATPMQLLLASLASCTTMTIAMYAKRKEWALQSVSAEANGQRSDDTPGPFERIELAIRLEGELSDEQRDRILAIAGKCPVHRTLASGVDIETKSV